MNSVIRILGVRRVGAALLLAGALIAPVAQAGSVSVSNPPTAPTAIAGSTLVKRSYGEMQSFSATGAGTFTVKLENLPWPERLAQLNCSVFSNDGLIQQLSESGEFSFDVTGPGTYFAKITALAQGALKIGLFSFKVSFDPAASPVPVPAAVWLLASGLGLLGFRQRALRAKRGH